MINGGTQIKVNSKGIKTFSPEEISVSKIKKKCREIPSKKNK